MYYERDRLKQAGFVAAAELPSLKDGVSIKIAINSISKV
jgi:hypothetical protein